MTEAQTNGSGAVAPLEQAPSGEGSYGVISRIHLPKAALAFSGVEVPAAVVSLITDSPWPIAGMTLASAWTVGETIHNLHNWRRQPITELSGFKRWLVKPDEWKSKS